MAQRSVSSQADSEIHTVHNKEKKTNLEVDEETVQLLLAGTAIKVLAAGVQQRAHHADTEQVLRGIQGTG